MEVPLAADEPIAGAADVRRAIELGACDAVNVKLAGSGGFGPARDALRAARDGGIGAWLSSTLDGPWGIGAALQLASGRAALAGLRPGHARAVRRRAGASPARAAHGADGGAARARASASR